jgi:hypothetical protein
MYEHLKAEIEAQQINRFAAFFGSDHVNYESGSSLPNQLKVDGLFTGKILTILGICFNAYDNWSKKTLECIGYPDSKEGRLLYVRYHDSRCRAWLAGSAGLQDNILKHSADYYLFSNDQTEGKSIRK